MPTASMSPDRVRWTIEQRRGDGVHDAVTGAVYGVGIEEIEEP